MRTFPLASLLLVSATACLAAQPEPKREKSTLGVAPPAGAVVLFDGDSLRGWVKSDGKTPADWPVDGGVLRVGAGKGGIQTTKTLGSAQIHVEFRTPLMPNARGQARGNSGVYLAGSYELQILDSYGLKSQNNDCGAIYKQVAPLVNACKPPLEWQTYDITFHKAEAHDGKVEKKARVTIYQNGLLIIDDAEISISPGGVGTKEGDDGPIMLQDHGNDVQFRNLWAKPL